MTNLGRIALLFLAFSAGAAFGQDDPACAKIENAFRARPLQMAELLAQRDCLGGALDRAPVSKTVRRLVEKELPEDQLGEIGHLVDQALAEVAAYLAGAGSDPLATAMASELEVARKTMAARLPLGERDARGWAWDGNRKLFPAAPAVKVSAIELDCAQPTPACANALETGKAVFRAAKLVERSLAFSAKPDYYKALAAARVRDAKWHHYFDTARLQLPWELGVNGLLYRKANRDAKGFADVPAHQWILAHPSIGMEHVGGAQPGNRFQPALVIEWLGYNRWSWKNDGAMGTALGASLIHTYSDRAGISSARPGLMLHYDHKYSVAATRNSDKWGIVVSIDVAKLVTKVADEARSRFRLGGSGREAP
ncbi:MAG TPA: hypothetical protein VGJ74_11855 [Burkholderiales bacterium]